MANCDELKKIAYARLKSAESLMDVNDWDGAAYMLGYTLECTLKAAACKTLHLITYPDSSSVKGVKEFFQTHKFSELVVVAGVSDLFSFKGSSKAWQNWSNFISQYPGNWPEMRYNADPTKNWDETRTKKIHDYLTVPPDGIMIVITNNNRW